MRMEWDFRMLRTDPAGKEIFALVKVYYGDTSGLPRDYDDTELMTADSKEELLQLLEMASKAYLKPILCLNIDGDLEDWQGASPWTGAPVEE